MRYNVLKITPIMSAMLMVMIVTLLMVACPAPKAGTDGTDAPKVPVLKTLVAPGAVTKPKAAVDTLDKDKLTVKAIAPTTLGKDEYGEPIDAETIKYELYYTRFGHSKDYARFGHSKGDITIDGGTSIADIAKAADTTANGDAGIVPITGNTLLSTTGFVIPDLSKDTIYRYFIRSIHPKDETKHTDTAARWAFVLNPTSTKVRVIILPDGKTSIKANAFRENDLTSVFIPDSVTSIGEGAFAVNSLTSVMIPTSVTSIGKEAFQYNNLTGVTIGNKVMSIGDMAFQHNKLMSVTIGNSVTSIGWGAFADNKLKSVTIPTSVTSIGIQAFANNAGLTSVTLSSDLYKKIQAEGSLNNTFGAKVIITYQDHAGTKLNL